MPEEKEIWVLLELAAGEEVGRLSEGLLSEARCLADRVGGSVTALIFTAGDADSSETLERYGADSALVYKHPLLEHFSAEAYSAALSDRLQADRPWLFLLGDTVAGRELAPRLAVALGTAVISGCVKIDLRNPGDPRFYRPIYGGQVYQELACNGSGTIFVTLDSRSLNDVPYAGKSKPKITVIEPQLSKEDSRMVHLRYLPSDVRTVDVSDADVIVSAGMGAIAGDTLSLVEELAGLIDGAVGATRPVVDEGKLSKERMIGQTGKVVSPDMYLALGISGVAHHVAGIQESKTIVSVNRDPQAAIFQNSDVGVVADLKDVLPGLIEKIRRAKKDGTIL